MTAAFGLVWKGGHSPPLPRRTARGLETDVQVFSPSVWERLGGVQSSCWGHGLQQTKCVFDTAPPVSNTSTLTPSISPLALVGTVGGPAL